VSLLARNGGDAGQMKPERVFIALIGCTFLWGWSFPLTRMMAGEFPPIVLAALRGGIGAATLIVWFLAMRESALPQSRREILDWIVLGSLNGWVPNLFVSYATQFLPAGQAAMIQACGPLLTALMANRMFADEKLTATRLIGILVGFAGVGLLVGPRMIGAGATPLAAAAMLGVALCYASGNIYVRMMPVADPKRLALGQQVFSAIAANFLAFSMIGLAGFASLPANIGKILALGMISTAAPIVIFMYILRAAGPTRASLTGYMVPAWAVVIAAVVLGETIGLREGLAGAIILAGVYIVSRAKARTS
jgi:drug/metabolite transporter (DMT)-like permease